MNLRIHQTIQTPNGPGIVQGRLIDKNNDTEQIIVSHNPQTQQLPAEVLECWFGGPWVLFAYDLDQITELK